MSEQYEQIMKNWTEAEWAEAVALEKELHVSLTEGLREETAWTLIHSLMILRKLPKYKSSTVDGIVDVALRLGAVELVKQAYPGAARAAARPKSKLAGKGIR